MHGDEEAKEGSREDIEGEGGDEEMEGCKCALTLSKGRVVEDGLVHEDLMNRQTLAWRDLSEDASLGMMLLAAQFHVLVN